MHYCRHVGRTPSILPPLHMVLPPRPRPPPPLLLFHAPDAAGTGNWDTAENFLAGSGDSFEAPPIAVAAVPRTYSSGSRGLEKEEEEEEERRDGGGIINRAASAAPRHA